ncbi:hypothetical protein ACFE04_020744 [Oxalis oulophora]
MSHSLASTRASSGPLVLTREETSILGTTTSLSYEITNQPVEKTGDANRRPMQHHIRHISSLTDQRYLAIFLSYTPRMRKGNMRMMNNDQRNHIRRIRSLTAKKRSQGVFVSFSVIVIL